MIGRVMRQHGDTGDCESGVSSMRMTTEAPTPRHYWTWAIDSQFQFQLLNVNLKVSCLWKWRISLWKDCETFYFRAWQFSNKSPWFSETHRHTDLVTQHSPDLTVFAWQCIVVDSLSGEYNAISDWFIIKIVRFSQSRINKAFMEKLTSTYFLPCSRTQSLCTSSRWPERRRYRYFRVLKLLDSALHLVFSPVVLLYRI